MRQAKVNLSRGLQQPIAMEGYHAVIQVVAPRVQGEIHQLVYNWMRLSIVVLKTRCFADLVATPCVAIHLISHIHVVPVTVALRIIK